MSVWESPRHIRFSKIIESFGRRFRPFRVSRYAGIGFVFGFLLLAVSVVDGDARDAGFDLLADYVEVRALLDGVHGLDLSDDF